MEGGEPAAEPAAASTREASVQSLLDKPLAELTEEDIAQLTREDCRRFLKAKGMRRPSWNKGQAIQQVISLKALIEGRPGSGDCPAGGGILCKPLPCPLKTVSQPQDSAPATPEDRGDASSNSGAKVPANEPSPYRRRDLIPPPPSAGDPICRTQIARSYTAHPPANRYLFPRVTAEPPARQMTVFYDGKVNVYNGVPVDQARTIMELAASPICFDDPTAPTIPPAPRPLPVFRLPRPSPSPTAPPFARSFPIPSSGRERHRVAEGLEERRVPREAEPGKRAEQFTG
ncbi:protein TIFY 4B isoform X3 [Canna indica]|uniref:Protein TIFY n=1 Tax=Canna indica TaxID=4628 RepID=A0AAQ3KKZ6_9LILI|nr:protein TIFY 4B isoform X3 [Canna indica]